MGKEEQIAQVISLWETGDYKVGNCQEVTTPDNKN